MADLKNETLIKIMWLPEEDEVLFNMRTEEPLSIKSELYSRLIDINKWKDLYQERYNEWLNKDISSIYDINDAVNSMMFKSFIELNKILENEMIFYWFDIDRTYNEEFAWKYCPLSKKELIPLGNNYARTNSFISPDYPLVFP